jgi:hypothetical protein
MVTGAVFEARDRSLGTAVRRLRGLRCDAVDVDEMIA